MRIWFSRDLLPIMVGAAEGKDVLINDRVRM
jgi:hypothetical protein